MTPLITHEGFDMVDTKKVIPLRRNHELLPHVMPSNAKGMSWAEVAAWFLLARINALQSLRDFAVFYGLNRINWLGVLGLALVAASACFVIWALHMAMQNLPWYVDVAAQLLGSKS
jgi:hypothetical protein